MANQVLAALRVWGKQHNASVRNDCVFRRATFAAVALHDATMVKCVPSPGLEVEVQKRSFALERGVRLQMALEVEHNFPHNRSVLQASRDAATSGRFSLQSGTHLKNIAFESNVARHRKWNQNMWRVKHSGSTTPPPSRPPGIWSLPAAACDSLADGRDTWSQAINISHADATSAHAETQTNFFIEYESDDMVFTLDTADMEPHDIFVQTDSPELANAGVQCGRAIKEYVQVGTQTTNVMITSPEEFEAGEIVTQFLRACVRSVASQTTVCPRIPRGRHTQTPLPSDKERGLQTQVVAAPRNRVDKGAQTLWEGTQAPLFNPIATEPGPLLGVAPPYYLTDTLQAMLHCVRTHRLPAPRAFQQILGVARVARDMSNEGVSPPRIRSRSRPPTPPPAPPRPSLNDTVVHVCKFHEQGRCRFGDKCAYHHAPRNLQMASRTRSSSRPRVPCPTPIGSHEQYTRPLTRYK